MAINVLVLGSGGREHALCWKLRQSPLLGMLYAAPGNAGIAGIATIPDLDVNDPDAVVGFAQENTIGLVVIGPEALLVAGLADHLRSAGIPAFGPGAQAAMLEGSKGFTKDLCAKAGIPTASYRRFTDPDAAKAYIRETGAPLVVKADGLAAGKGVTVAQHLDEALAAVDQCFSGKFGAGDAGIVVEEYMEGEEASFFALVDGDTVLPLATAQDHKAIGDGDTGPNTGGMGSYSPAPVMTPELCLDVMERIVEPTVAAMAAAGTPFIGVLYAGLMITRDGPKLIEYNARFGDPECQVLMMRLASDVLPLLLAAATGKLAGCGIDWRDDAALTVVMANQGYPDTSLSGDPITGLDAAAGLEGVEIFHAGTKMEAGHIVAIGGRVLNVTALGATVADAQARAYRALALIDWPHAIFRRDIGWRAVEREQGAKP